MAPKKPAQTTLLIAGFHGPQDLLFDHAIVEAFYWSERSLCDCSASLGFQVFSTQTRPWGDGQPHISVVARLQEFTVEEEF